MKLLGQHLGLITMLRSLSVAAPGLVALGLVLATGVPDRLTSFLLFTVASALTVALAIGIRAPRSNFRLSMSNLIEAMREGDYGVRGGLPKNSPEDMELMQRVNALADHLQHERLRLHENLQLLDKTLATLDSAVFVFDADSRLRLVNPAGERLLGAVAQSLIGRSDSDLGLGDLFATASSGIETRTFAGHRGRWQVNHASLRSGGKPGRLLVLQPIEKALRREEVNAFGRLLRVLGHEINNSMAPIISVAGTLENIIGRSATAPDTVDDVRDGLRLIHRRSTALQRFVEGYAKLAQLPAPKPAPLSLAIVIDQVRGLFSDGHTVTQPGEDLDVVADRDQLEQVLINLLRNAIEASGDHLPVVLRWYRHGLRARIEILDNGHGLPPSDSLFVPFFTTKPGGSGIGLVLSRQIIEGQNGTIELHNRLDANGAVAVIELPCRN